MWPQEWKEGCPERRAWVNASLLCTYDYCVSFIHSQSGYTNLLQGSENPMHDRVLRNGLDWFPQPGRKPRRREQEEHPTRAA